MSKIILFGNGHLGQFLLPKLKNYDVVSTKTKSDKNNIEYNLGQPIPREFTDQPSAVIWTIPPRQYYLKSLKQANTYFSQKVPWFFISSTSVYLSGSVNEDSPLNGTSENAKRLVELENYLSQQERSVTVLRPGGLVDEYRHPARFLSQKTTIENGLDPVNLVHTDDVANFIQHLLANPRFMGTTYNLVSDTSMTKKDYYLPFLKNYFNSSPDFSESTHSLKSVSNKKAKSLGFKFKDVSFSNLKLLFAQGSQ
ncbi:MAG: hypothetical protein MK008_05665 [Bdellovibrionales bacterium]|nr:hypothetical protein [Bdellovibrionales bacterium]